ncbi:protein mono-ADP-ribosyltransferase PARP14 [Dryobates pubescens]|uniref:protein mono-ADP-ribosyltransferase PARP14 n=1 Tax=Dryobates pubescens TaxID=118200 RepID=UPI0023B90C5F|nr:protein mono-ADP-ribosyltransferase PARP14 [Dryobates pubescens]
MSNLQTKDNAEALEETKSFVPNSEEAGSLENIAEKSAVTSASVVFENTEGCSPECLSMLIENISGLAVDDGFTMEVIPEINVAVATFTKSIDTTQFVNKCLQNKRLKEFQVTARLLELTRSIKAEEVPASVSTDYITVYFENARNGGGPVADVQLLPKEKAAIVTFCDHKDLKTVLEKQHLLDQTEISVHPYYHSLGEALYGAARPTVKMPDPFGVPLDPYVWQFLQKQATLIQDINQEMAVCHCELKWPQADCERPEITVCPSPSLSKQKKSATKLIKTWKQNASAEFSRLMAHYVAIKCKVSSVNWEDLRNRLAKDVALIITDISEETVVIAGNRAAVDSAEKEMRDCMEKATRDSEREKLNLEISMFVTPGKYAVLHNAGLEDNIHEEYPYLKIFYDDVNKTVHMRGLLAEVYKVKADLLEKLLNIPCTSVTIDPLVLYYLQRVDSKRVSETLFTKKNINAFYELEDDSVLLFGDAPEDLSEAERQIKTSLEYKCISVEDGEVTKKEQWRILLASLGEEYSSSEESVVIDEPAEKQNEVVIAGFSKAVTEVYQKLTDFLDRNTHVEEVIPAKLAVVVQYVEEEKSNICLELRKKGVSVCFDTKKPSISLSGPKAEVSKAVTTFKAILSSLYSRDVPIDKPGAREFFTERKDSWIFEAKQRFSCLIRLEEEEEGKEQNQENDEKIDNRKLFYKEMLPDGVVVAVYKGNLCNYPADVVVNPANEDLKHTGGLADALFKAAGPELQQDCDELLRKNGSLHPGCAVITRAGKLPCKNVIHAVGPRWRQHETEQCVCLLKKAVKKSLQLAGIYDHHSIALPAISGAIFGFPLQTYGDSVVSSIQETLEKSVGDSSLKEVHLVSDEEEMVRVLSETVKKVFAGESSSQTLLMKESQKKRKDLKMITTDEGLCIRVEEKNIQEATTDVIVNSVGEDLKFGVGPLCKALLEKAGPDLKEEFDEEAECPSTFGESVLCTSGYNLACKFVLHAILPAWDGEIGQNTKTLENIITSCLKETENLGLKSIAFPAIGTGGFGFPKAVVSKLMFDVVFKFSSSRTVKSLQEVHILLDPKDVDNIQVFTSELERRIAGSRNAEGPQSTFLLGKSQDTMKKKDVVLEKKVDLATFQICGESQENVDAAESWIENLILKEQFENTISDELIANFDDSEIDILADLQRRKHVTIQLENHLSPPCIKISGISRDVYFVSVEVQKMVKKIKDTEEERSKAELVYNLVEWRYSASNGTFVAFDKLTNMQLEDAKLAKVKYITVKINQKKYKVDLKTLQAKDHQGKTLIFQRVQKNEGKLQLSQQSIQLPEHWNDMQNEWVKVVNLQPSHQEYLVVQKKFKRTCPNYTITKIERIQNPFLWQTYQIKKISLCKKNRNQNNEKLLFHGTPSSSLSMINYNGFNRGFAGKNGASIGNGTYFAVDASYSAQKTWSTPDVDGKRYMYLARVLTGKYCLGRKGLITPPPKHSSDPTDLYDSVVDCVNAPTMFVIFNDIQAYPEYLITFKK